MTISELNGGRRNVEDDLYSLDTQHFLIKDAGHYLNKIILMLAHNSIQDRNADLLMDIGSTSSSNMAKQNLECKPSPSSSVVAYL